MRYSLTRVLPYTPDQVFDLVGDVARYPEFVPWITAMRVQDERATGEGRSLLTAEAAVGFAFLKERFSTEVARDAGARDIRVTLLAGPFRRLENRWRFRSHVDGCEVFFDIDFEFKSRVLGLLLQANFGVAVDRLISCFEARAQALYGTAPVNPGAPEAAVMPS